MLKQLEEEEDEEDEEEEEEEEGTYRVTTLFFLWTWSL